MRTTAVFRPATNDAFSRNKDHAKTIPIIEQPNFESANIGTAVPCSNRCWVDRLLLYNERSAVGKLSRPSGFHHVTGGFWYRRLDVASGFV